MYPPFENSTTRIAILRIPTYYTSVAYGASINDITNIWGDWSKSGTIDDGEQKMVKIAKEKQVFVIYGRPQRPLVH